MTDSEKHFQDVVKRAGRAIARLGKKVTRPVRSYEIKFNSYTTVSISNYLGLIDRSSAAYNFIMKLDEADIQYHRGGKNHEVFLSLKDYMEEQGIQDEDEAHGRLGEVAEVLVGMTAGVHWVDKDDEDPSSFYTAFASSLMPIFYDDDEEYICLNFTPTFWEIVKNIPQALLDPAFIECMEKMYRKKYI